MILSYNLTGSKRRLDCLVSSLVGEMCERINYTRTSVLYIVLVCVYVSFSNVCLLGHFSITWALMAIIMLCLFAYVPSALVSMLLACLVSVQSVLTLIRMCDD